MVSSGRVLLMPKGEYNAATTYSMLDIVSYNGSSYVAKQSTTGNLPTNTTYWQLSAYGGSAANLAGNFATLETTAYASTDYEVGDFLVNKDNQMCKVIADITTGDELVLETNIEVTSVGALIQEVIAYADDLDAENVKLKGMTAISAQTDLDDMTTPGNFYKSSTSFYVTNAPTGIASELTAIFRLTVENGSDTTNKYIQTLRTNDNKTYTRAYDGSDWSDWIEFADAAEVSALDTALDNEVETRAKLGAHNLLPFPYSDTTKTPSDSGTTYTVNSDGTITVTATGNPSANSNFALQLDWKLPKGNYIFSGIPTGAATTSFYAQLLGDVDYTTSGGLILLAGETPFTLTAENTLQIRLYIRTGWSGGTITFNPMIRLASDTDSTYRPYAMTNQELTANVLKTAKITFPAVSVNSGVIQNFTLTSQLLPADFHELIAIIPISVGPEGWGSSVPAVLTVPDMESKKISLRSYVSQNYAPVVQILYR